MYRTKFVVAVFVTILIFGLTADSRADGTVIIPVSGEEQLTLVEPGVQWMDSDGITHMRGLIYASELSGHDGDGVPITGAGLYELNLNIDLNTGNGDVQASGTAEQHYGDLSGEWRAQITATITGFVYDGTVNCPRGFGDFTGWHFRATWTGIFGGGPTQFEGAYQIPGGAKSVATESASWSSVKALFR
jgi:hypothetical protein